MRPLESIGRYGMSRSIAAPLGFTRKDCAVHLGVDPIVSGPLPVVSGRFLAAAQISPFTRGTTPGVRAQQALRRTTACAAGCVLCGRKDALGTHSFHARIAAKSDVPLADEVAN
jgi:hypothetical protein